MTTLEDLLAMNRRSLRNLISTGHAVDPNELSDRQMNGVSLAVPVLARPFAWVKFRKTFKKLDDGSLRGWNVQCEQTPLDQPWKHVMRKGEPVTYGHYKLRPQNDMKTPGPMGQGQIIDYTIGGNGLLDPMNFVRDPLVAVNEGDHSLLLGLSWVELGFTRFVIPAYFALAGGDPLDHDAKAPRG